MAIALGVFVDQVTKYWASMSLRGNNVEIVSTYLMFHLVKNPGIAFGMPVHGVLLLVFTGTLITGLLWYLFRHFRELSTLERAGYACIISGALGNAYDRFVHGAVVDFVSLKYFAIFNVADIVISVGALLIILTQYQKISHAK